MNILLQMFKMFPLLLIRLYQKTISFDHGIVSKFFPYGYCRFHPTCSEYCYQAISQHGVFKGSFLTFYRLFRCNPWSKGGEDPVPSKQVKK
ncbi:membrane protein insertion efficiency factor YidD [Patescibacteria group bacterium]